jgi:hypothetical protein
MIRDLDTSSVLKVENGKPSLDAGKLRSFLEKKSLPPATIDALIPKIQERLKFANPVN